MKRKNKKGSYTVVQEGSEGSPVIFERSSGNVFKDMGLENPEERLEKSKIVSKIQDLIIKHSIDNKTLYIILGLKSKDIENVLSGKLKILSIEELQEYFKILEAYI